MYASNVHADTHIYAAPYVHADTHFDTEANKDANPCDRSADTIHTNRSTLPPWLDSRAVLCGGWYVDTDPNIYANGRAYKHSYPHFHCRRTANGWAGARAGTGVRAGSANQYASDPYADAKTECNADSTSAVPRQRDDIGTSHHRQH